MRCISKCNNYKNTKWALHEMFIVAKIVLKYYLAFSNIFPAFYICIFYLVSVFLILKTHPVYLLGRCIGKYVGTEVSSAISYSCPCCCHHRLRRTKRENLKKNTDKHQNMWNNKSYSSFEYIKITTYFISCLIPSRCGIFLHHCELSEIFY